MNSLTGVVTRVFGPSLTTAPLSHGNSRRRLLRGLPPLVRSRNSPLCFRLADLDEVAVGIVQVAPCLDLMNLRLGEELRAETLPTFVTLQAAAAPRRVTRRTFTRCAIPPTHSSLRRAPTPFCSRVGTGMSTRMVLDRFGHMFEGARRQAAETMDRVFENVRLVVKWSSKNRMQLRKIKRRQAL